MLSQSAMTGLFDPARHEPLNAAPWNEGTAMEAIRRIADASLAAYVPGSGWPVHPRDRSTPPVEHLHDLYFGSGGVVWALHYLAQCGALAARCLISRALSPHFARRTGSSSSTACTGVRRISAAMPVSISCPGPCGQT